MIRTMDSFTGTMASLRIKILSRYTTRTMTRIPRFCHFTDHSICLSSFAHVGDLSDRFRRFTHVCIDIGYIPPFLHMSAAYTGHSAVFAHHSINLYSYRMSVVSVSIAVWDIFCHSAVFAHHSIWPIQHLCIDSCLSSIPPFLRTIQLTYTVCLE